MNKITTLLLVATLVGSSFKSFSQEDEGKIFKIGYRAGITRFNPAFVSTPGYNVNSSGQLNPTPLTPAGVKYSDYIIPTNFDVWFGKNGEHAFYDVNIGGMFNAFGSYVYDLASGSEPNWRNEKLHSFNSYSWKDSSNTTYVARASDYDVLSGKIGFGGNGIFGGFQFGWTKFGSTNGSGGKDMYGNQLSAIGGTYVSYGLGLHVNKGIDGFYTQNALEFSKVGSKKNNSISGYEVKLVSTIYIFEDKGFYIAPYLIKRGFEVNDPNATALNSNANNNGMPTGTVTPVSDKLKVSSIAFGVSAGFFLFED